MENQIVANNLSRNARPLLLMRHVIVNDEKLSYQENMLLLILIQSTSA